MISVNPARAYIHYHSARLRDPSRYVRVRHVKDELGKGINVLYGILPASERGPRGGRTERQAILFDPKRFTPAQAKAWVHKHGMHMIAFEPARGGRNPALVVISNPIENPATVEKAYEDFHFVQPDEVEEIWIPEGWPSRYMLIGDLDRLDVAAKGKGTVKCEFDEGQAALATTKEWKDLFVFGRRLGIPSGTALYCEYTVPEKSGRNEMSAGWYHDHDSRPKVEADPSGKAVRISGPGLSFDDRGIDG